MYYTKNDNLEPVAEYMDPVKSLIQSARNRDAEKMSLILKRGLDPNSFESRNSR